VIRVAERERTRGEELIVVFCTTLAVWAIVLSI
jgi:hypothetical protein